MHSTFHLRRVFPLVLPVAAVVSGFSWGGQAWLLTFPAMFLLGRSYGSGAQAQPPSNGATYGVGAALAGFTPEDRG